MQRSFIAGSGLKPVLLVILGLMWSVRLAAIKWAGLSEIPVHVVVSVSAFGIALFFSALSTLRDNWPALNRSTALFYCFSGVFGFLAPFTLESFVAPNLPVFVFVVIISTMPIITALLAGLTRAEKMRLQSVISIGFGFLGAMLILSQTHEIPRGNSFNLVTVLAAFGVPILYAVNTVFVAVRWPKSVTATQVAHAQAIIVSVAAFVTGMASASLGSLTLVFNNAPAVILIVFGEALGLLLYLRITHDHGASYVSLANYISMGFAALIGAVFFDDRLTAITLLAAALISVAVFLHQRRST